MPEFIFERLHTRNSNPLYQDNPASYMHYDYAYAGKQVALQWRVKNFR